MIGDVHIVEESFPVRVVDEVTDGIRVTTTLELIGYGIKFYCTMEGSVTKESVIAATMMYIRGKVGGNS